jgi:fatty acid CoA ligase FadD32
VTGRIKDLIIVDGRNIYPHDIEYTVEQAHDAIAQRRLAAFSVPTETGEAMVVVAEKYRHSEDAAAQLEEISRAARSAVSHEHSVALYDFVLVEPDTVARTSSGKIARKATRASYLEGTLQAVRTAADGESA